MSRPLARQRSEPRRVGEDWRQPEARAELVAPLLAKTRGCDDERPTRGMTMGELQEEETCLNCLAQTNAVSDEHPGDAVAEHGKRRLQLIGQQANRHLRCRAKSAEWVQLHECAIEVMEPAARADGARTRIAVDWLWTIEGRQERLLEAVAALPQPDRRAIDRAGQTFYGPPPATHQDASADFCR